MTKQISGQISEAYVLQENLSQNAFCEAWSGVNSKTGKTCFLKIYQYSDRPDDAGPVFIQSAKLQGRIKSQLVVTARTANMYGSALCVEYPFLDRNIWCPLDPELFWKYFPESLIQMSVLIDYLHLLGVVHCDLKLVNFLIRADGDQCTIKLVDLDFVTLSGTRPESKIIGTRGHIAPEILTNKIISALSDNYSVGAALRQCLEWWDDRFISDIDSARPDIGRLPDLVGALTATDPLDRPRNILDALHGYDIINTGRFSEALRLLLGMQMTTMFLNRRPKVKSPEKWAIQFINQDNRVFGLPEELLRDIGKAYPRRANTCLRAISTLIADSRISRFADYWHLSCADETLARVFAAVAVDKGEQSALGTTSAPNAETASRLIDYAKGYMSSNHRFKAFLCYKNCLDVNGLAPGLPPGILKEALFAAGALCKGMNRLGDAVRYLRQALTAIQPGTPEHFDTLDQLASLAMRIGQYPEAQEYIDSGLRLARQNDNLASEVDFQIHHGWCLASQGDITGAEGIFHSLLGRAEQNDWKDRQCRIYGYLGILARMRGHRNESTRLYKKALEAAASDPNPVGAIPILINYSQLSFECAQYAESIKLAKQAIKYAQIPDNAPRLPNLYLAIACSHTRLCEGEKSLYWLQKYLESLAGNSDNAGLAHYHSLLGWMEMNLGRLHEAREALQKSVELFRSRQFIYNRGKAYHNLAEIAFLAGDREVMNHYIAEANAIHDQLEDKASRAEAELIAGLDALFYDPQGCEQPLADAISALLQVDCRYYAALGLFCLLLRADRGSSGPVLHKAQELVAQCRISHAPLFQALAVVSELQAPGIAESHRILQLKNAYRLLERAGQLFPAIVISDKIGDVYAAGGKRRMSIKFWNQAIRLAEDLDNPRLIQKLRDKISTNSQDQTYLETRIESLAKVSEIIKNVDQYETTLESIVQFAVEETGAERGALLLRSPDSAELQVKAFVNCDNASLRDIWNLSRNIPSLVTQEALPLVIDNALRDDRTKDLKSIVMHNIHSVVCIPIKFDDAALGALYLDHHSIPSLFDDSDLVFISALANLIAVLLHSAERIRTAAADSQRLSHELVKMGASKRFLTVNAKMADMLKLIPEIARTNATILLVGDSGTGKEILCDMIHDLSLRTKKPLIKMNCAAIAGTLIESELFGVARGAATGVDMRDGKFSAADGGTLFLDEIADMPLDVQAKVLRVLENQQFEKVGSNRTIFTDIRFIAATNRDLKTMVVDGKFRNDLFHRINTIVIRILPLRERPEDIPVLLEHFLDAFSQGKDWARFSDDAVRALVGYHWPGNVRELRNFAERQSILNPGRPIAAADLPAEMRGGAMAEDGPSIREREEKAQLAQLLRLFDGNQSKVTRHLNIPLTTLRRKLKKYDLRH